MAPELYPPAAVLNLSDNIVHIDIYIYKRFHSPWALVVGRDNLQVPLPICPSPPTAALGTCNETITIILLSWPNVEETYSRLTWHGMVF